MIKFIKGYYDKNGRRINEWKANEDSIKTSYKNNSSEIIVIEGNVTNCIIEEMQKIVDKSIEDTENGKY